MSARLAAAEVLSGLYDAIADHTQFDGLLSAMDDFLDADPSGFENGQADWKRMFRQHFSRAHSFLDADLSDDRETPIVHVDRQVVPAAVINRRYDVLASNQLFSDLTSEIGRSLGEVISTPADKRRLSQLFISNDEAAPALISLTLPSLATPIFVVASLTSLTDLPGQAGPFVTLKVAKATWNPDLVPLLETAYELTSAEIEVLEGMVELGAVAAVAEARGRSVRTVRTQLTNIFAKLGLASQTELALFLATLTQLMTKEKLPSDVGHSWSTDQSAEMQECQIEIGGNTLSYLKYGDPDGLPVLLIHSTTPPDMTPDFRRACKDSGLQIIACHKPGSGGSNERPSSLGPDELAADYKAVLELEGVRKAIVAGHCSGGLYALRFSQLFPDLCERVVPVDTGVPFRTRRELMALPKSVRRTFLTARYIPEILLVPHRIFASNFKRSSAGEARVVDYFFDDSPVDRELTRTDRTYYEITRRIIEYSFEDVDRLVADVCRWAGDWSDLLELPDGIECIFVHGSENHMFSIDRIEAFTAQNQSADLNTADGLGQLQIYQDPSAFIRAVKGL